MAFLFELPQLKDEGPASGPFNCRAPDSPSVVFETIHICVEKVGFGIWYHQMSRICAPEENSSLLLDITESEALDGKNFS